jgi:hypothetical protein
VAHRLQHQLVILCRSTDKSEMSRNVSNQHRKVFYLVVRHAVAGGM